MLAVSTVLMMIACETYTGMQHLNEGWPWYRSLNAVLAGAVMTTVGLVLLMMAIGTDWEHRSGHNNHDHDKAHSGIGGVAVPVQNVRVVEERV
jgi:multisubunit Na+/H+ antiporter MnhB subunit